MAILKLDNNNLVEDERLFTFHSISASKKLIFTWKETNELTVDAYMNAIRRIAANCLKYRPVVILIDKTMLSADTVFDRSWWHAEILPQYHESEIKGMAHITGNTHAVGEYQNKPKGVNFKMAEFENLESALLWQLNGDSASPHVE